MKAQIVLTPSESKRLIAKAVSQMESVKNALKKGIVAICRTSTDAYVAEELTGMKMEKGNYVAGYVGPKGFGSNPKPSNEIILVDGKLHADLDLSDVIKDLRPGDVVIKSANALGPDGIPGVLLGRGRPATTGGHFGMFQLAAMARGVEVVVPVGLEKAIPISVIIGSREISSSKIDYATGTPVGFVPIFGTVITEVEALKSLTGVEVIPIAAGGIGGAEGSVILLLKGDDSEVKEAVKMVEKIKGEPPVQEPR
ncbi:MAG: hypothetical protein QG670_2311 [Thermoproteota archaeon]|nr:hypothetical protein [Thermoproteota archaeon]